MHSEKDLSILREDFMRCKDIFVALGDENRLHILYQIMLSKKYMGIRVGELVKMCNLSRPAISHHVKILKNAGIINVRREATKNYYFIDLDNNAFKTLESVIQRAIIYNSQLPNRNEDSL